MIKINKKGEYRKPKYYEKEIKSSFISYVQFESIVVAEYNGNRNQEESYTNKHKKHIACSYGYELVQQAL